MKLQLLFLGVLWLVLSGCAASTATTPATSQPISQAPGQTPTQISTQTSTPPVAATQSESPVPTAYARPTVRPGLEASDPAKFSLASGKLQLIEFFAFW